MEGTAPSVPFLLLQMQIGRRHPAHQTPLGLGNRATIIFVTICTARRQPILANAAHELIRAAWATAGGWLVGRYVIVPDHVHFFCAPGAEEPPPLGNWVRFWKTLVSRQWPNPSEQPIWQLDFWDRQLRQEESYRQKWEYVRANPVRHQLVQNAEDWPYQGELTQLQWHDR